MCVMVTFTQSKVVVYLGSVLQYFRSTGSTGSHPDRRCNIIIGGGMGWTGRGKSFSNHYENSESTRQKKARKRERERRAERARKQETINPNKIAHCLNFPRAK